MPCSIILFSSLDALPHGGIYIYIPVMFLIHGPDPTDWTSQTGGGGDQHIVIYGPV